MKKYLIVSFCVSTFCYGNILTPSPTNTPSNTPTITPTLTPTLTISNTPTKTPTDSPTNTQTNSVTRTDTNTPTKTPTNSPTKTPTLSPTVTITNTPTQTITKTPTKTITLTFSTTPLPTLTPTQTATAIPPPWAPIHDPIGYDYGPVTLTHLTTNKAVTFQKPWDASGVEFNITQSDSSGVSVFDEEDDASVLSFTNPNQTAYSNNGDIALFWGSIPGDTVDVDVSNTRQFVVINMSNITDFVATYHYFTRSQWNGQFQKPVPTLSPTKTFTLTITPTLTNSFTPTITPTPTNSFTPTITSTPTNTVTATPTPTGSVVNIQYNSVPFAVQSITPTPVFTPLGAGNYTNFDITASSTNATGGAITILIGASIAGAQRFVFNFPPNTVSIPFRFVYRDNSGSSVGLWGIPPTGLTQSYVLNMIAYSSKIPLIGTAP